MGVININGKKIEVVDGSNITINNGSIIVNGKNLYSGSQPIQVTVEGDVNNLRTDNSATVKGSVLGSVDAGNSVHCGDVGGDVDAGNSIHARVIKGKAKAGNKIVGF
jgi:hypothetical protein